MVEFLEIQFGFGNVTAEELNSFVGKWITQEQADEIIKSKGATT